MSILAIESSCDETAVAVYDDIAGLRAHRLHTQVALHAEYGGVVPELASRDHLTRVVPLVRDTLADAGLDFAEGDVLLEKGTVLDAGHLSLAAAGNHAGLPVIRRPIVGVLATGDELVAPGNETGPGQIVASNGYGVAAIARDAGAEVIDLGIARDSAASLEARLDAALAAKCDVLITLGGASVGDHDLVRPVFTGRRMTLDFYKIAMRPGKPMMFGRLGAMRRKPARTSPPAVLAPPAPARLSETNAVLAR